jgi:hypothetical protein
VRTDADRVGQAAQILNRFSPTDIEQRAAEWRSTGWSGPAGTTAEAATIEDTVSQPGASGPSSAGGSRFEDFDSVFRDDFRTRYGTKGFEYEKYRPAYQYGWAARDRFEDRDWTTIEPELHADWQNTHPTEAWEDVREAVRYAWQRVRTDERGLVE